MAIFRCKMCGGDLEIVDGASYCICEYCGSKQTIPTVQDDALRNLFNRANVLRMKSEFDKAADIYEKILQNSGTEAEAYWGLILCKYGVEYVEDPKTFTRIPTCHRTSYDAITADEDYKNALSYADAAQRGIYEQEAKAIDTIQKGIISLAQREDPYDVFICYKEADENGKRTQDSVIANDVYYQLTQEGFKVFYAAITLEDKLGSEYEPYIFSALNTARVMLVLGTKPEYFNSVWVRNEWSRFLKIMKKDRTKLLIPCFRDMDAYELPEEFAHLQAQDMSKIGFIQDLIRGVNKVLDAKAPKTVEKETVKETVIAQNEGGLNINIASLLDRGYMAVEDNEWDKADGFFEQVLNADSRNGEAYLGKFLISVHCISCDDYAYSRIKAIRSAKIELDILDAFPNYNEIVAEHARKYAVDGYITEKQIKDTYIHSHTYHSAVRARRDQLDMELKYLSANKHFVRAEKYSTGKCKQSIQNMKQAIITAAQDRINNAEKTANLSREKVFAECMSFIEETTNRSLFKAQKYLQIKIQSKVQTPERPQQTKYFF